MNQETINSILQQMSGCLDNSQMIRLKQTLEESLKEDGGTLEKSSKELLELFLATKSLEGRSEKTIRLYRYCIERLLERTTKNVCVMTTDDIRDYLSEYRMEKGIGKVTVDNVRRNLSSFFKWLEDENYIFKSPLRRIHKIKTTISVKDTYADEDLEKLRDECKELRNLAIIDILNSTGMPIEQVQKLLGHEKIDTTLQYAMVKQSNVKIAHKKYIG